jgi:hypothetical protein
MFGMTIAAFHHRVDAVHSAVFREHIAHLRGNIGMTRHTTVTHRLIFPGRHVTETTISGDLRMRRDSAKDVSLNSIQRSGAEHRTTARHGNTHDGKCSDQRGNNASPSETSQTTCSHSLSSINTDKGFLITSRM